MSLDKDLATNIKNICMECMALNVNEGICGVCGCDNKNIAEEPHQLPYRTILNERYVTGKVLGYGGFGITYLAYDLKLGVKLAIKEYFPHDFITRQTAQKDISIFNGDAREHFTFGMEKFLEEARILAKFEDHPGIFTVKDFFEQYGTAYMVMNYLEGLTLKDYVDSKGGKLEYNEAIDIIMPVLDTLREVHGVGLLHRDISLENILITKAGQVKLIDFGAARHSLGEYSKSMSIILKPGYSPEEQYRSKGKQGPWTDIYAIAATMYRIITGVLPPDSLERLHEDTLKKPTDLGINLPVKIEKAILKALAINAKDRYQNVLDFQNVILGNSDAVDIKNEKKIDKIKYNLKNRKIVILAIVTTILVTCIGGIYWAKNNKISGAASKKVVSVNAKQNMTSKEKKSAKEISVRSEKTMTLETKTPTKEMIIMEDFTAKNIADIRKYASSNGLILTEHEENNYEFSEGIVFKQNPLKGEELEKGSKIEAFVSTGPENFVKVIGGEFEMGSPSYEAWRDDEEFLHSVKVDDFYIGKYEVTVAEFEAFINNTNYVTDADKYGIDVFNDDADDWEKKLGVNWRDNVNGDTQTDKKNPVVHVSWNDAKAYCEWFKRDKKLKNCRLPTEAEWEYACRAGTVTPFNTGNNITADQANYGGDTTTPVGSYAPNKWGIYDMHGNVWEWCEDWYDKDYYQECHKEGVVKNPLGPENGEYLVKRGGCWNDIDIFCRSANRDRDYPDAPDDFVGFRVIFLQ